MFAPPQGANPSSRDAQTVYDRELLSAYVLFSACSHTDAIESEDDDRASNDDDDTLDGCAEMVGLDLDNSGSGEELPKGVNTPENGPVAGLSWMLKRPKKRSVSNADCFDADVQAAGKSTAGAANEVGPLKRRRLAPYVGGAPRVYCDDDGSTSDHLAEGPEAMSPRGGSASLGVAVPVPLAVDPGLVSAAAKVASGWGAHPTHSEPARLFVSANWSAVEAAATAAVAAAAAPAEEEKTAAAAPSFSLPFLPSSTGAGPAQGDIHSTCTLPDAAAKALAAGLLPRLPAAPPPAVPAHSAQLPAGTRTETFLKHGRDEDGGGGGSSSGGGDSSTCLKGSVATMPVLGMVSPSVKAQAKAHAQRLPGRKDFFVEALKQQLSGLWAENQRLRGLAKAHLPSERAGPLLAGCIEEQPSVLTDTEVGLPAQYDQSSATLLRVLRDAQRSYVVTDPRQLDNPIVWVSPNFCSLTGYSRDEILGRNCRFLQGPETGQTVIARIRKSLDGKYADSVCLVNYRKDGTPFWNNLYISPLFDDKQEVVHYIGVQCDVTAAYVPEVHVSQLQCTQRHCHEQETLSSSSSTAIATHHEVVPVAWQNASSLGSTVR